MSPASPASHNPATDTVLASGLALVRAFELLRTGGGIASVRPDE
jgi:hypothetical protein